MRVADVSIEKKREKRPAPMALQLLDQHTVAPSVSTLLFLDSKLSFVCVLHHSVQLGSLSHRRQRAALPPAISICNGPPVRAPGMCFVSKDGCGVRGAKGISACVNCICWRTLALMECTVGSA
ncbi:hypothetical protein BC939DRAFT_435216 [Gamsiella multidivaricata]|uniref:uncharacterized protein n=1 Tax=Gamsiella multidivaricata TaxID=101098 RepID=UPI002220EFD5|nr:uncharacterized protein BC939DRAFT_435216 [Gamsiella multidivaricata]KAI7832332.1 hypothetical protein BC939DRAFT_435216 [Gamsiella multidivaricata]